MLVLAFPRASGKWGGVAVSAVIPFPGGASPPHDKTVGSVPIVALVLERYTENVLFNLIDVTL